MDRSWTPVTQTPGRSRTPTARVPSWLVPCAAVQVLVSPHRATMRGLPGLRRQWEAVLFRPAGPVNPVCIGRPEPEREAS